MPADNTDLLVFDALARVARRGRDKAASSDPALDILASIRRRTEAPPAEKVAFTPAPAVAQAVMAQAQGGGDPNAAAMGGAPPGAPPPGTDPAAAGGAPPAPPPPGPPPGTDPSAGGGVGGPPALDPTTLQAITQAVQQAMGGQAGAPGQPGATGPGAKPNKDQLMMEMHHQLKAMVAIVRPMAEAMGLEVPAGHLFDMGPGAPAAGAGPGSPAPGGAPSPGGAGGPPPSAIAQQLPNLPPVAGKTASAESVSDRLARISTGFPVPAQPGDLQKSRIGATLAAMASRN